MDTKTEKAEDETDLEAVFQLGYASAATEPFSQEELEELLAKARLNNAALGVTGMLLYHEGSFIQVLEGPQQAVAALYAKIAEDPRHENAVLLFKSDASERSFEQWTMGFHQLKKNSADTPAGLNRFLENGASGITSEDGEKIKGVLMGFRGGKWHRTVDH